VLELGVPRPEAPGTLAHKLAEQWPSYAAYVVSFVTIGVIWINHHAMLRRVQTVDHSALVFNLLLLMLIAVLPWTTALLAEYLREDDGQHLAAAIYGGSLLAMALSFLRDAAAPARREAGAGGRDDRTCRAQGDHAPQHGRAAAVCDRDRGGAALLVPRARDLRRRRRLLRAAGDHLQRLT
jgi:uncharacterized membrane protein